MNNDPYQFQIEQVSPGFSERYLLQPEQFAHELEQYHKYIKQMIIIADPTANAQSFADDIIAVSKDLAKVYIFYFKIGARGPAALLLS